MTDKAYIVANKQQELDVLKKLEKDGFNWPSGLNPTNFFPSNSHPFPIVLFERDCITWDFLDSIKNEEIMFDGRKEEKMYKVTQEFMNELIKWREDWNLDAKTGLIDTFINGDDINNIPNILDAWWFKPDNPIENNNRLIAIIQWLNGEDVFEVEAQHKFVVRSENVDDGGHYGYVAAGKHGITYNRYYIKEATKFDTREEAQEWANSHQAVVEIDADGNEVE